MDYTTFINALKEMSTFDMYRVSCALQNELTNPERIANIKKQLHIGKKVSFYDSSRNVSLDAEVTEIGKKKVTLHIINSNWSCEVPYFSINFDNVETTIHDSSEKLTINTVSVGECVGFTHKGREIIGVIMKLNPKTATLISNDGNKWRVGYNYLYRVLDSQATKHNVITIEA